VPPISPTPSNGCPPGTWIDCRGNVRVPSQEFHYDDGRVVYGQEAIQAGMRWIDGMQEHNRRVLRKLSPLQLHMLERRLRTGGSTQTPRAVAIITPRTRDRERHPSRRTAAFSSTSSSDPGDPDPPGAGELRHISGPLAAELNRIAARLRTRGGVG
jgi:hypothetical protein